MQKQPDLRSDAFGFMKSRVILTAAELDLFTELDKDFFSIKDLSAKLNLDERATTRLLDCLITFGLLEKQNSRYKTTEQGSYLSSRHPQSILPSVKHGNHLWNNWSHLTIAVKKGTNPHSKSGTDARSNEETEAFIGAMHLAAKELSTEISNAYDLRPFKRLLDVGGGSGAYTISFLQNNPQLHAIIFDLPRVIPIAEEKIREAKLEDRVNFVVGDFSKDELPGGCDLILLSAIIHQNSPDQNFDLFRKIYQALESRGTLLIRDHIMDASRTKPPAGAMFALNMLVNTMGGDTYTFDEVKGSLEMAGFDKVEMVLAGEKMDCIVEAKKPNNRQDKV